MRILGIDYGEARCGFAISDKLGYTAQALGSLHTENNDKVFTKKVLEYVLEYDATKVVIGYPKHMNGDISVKALKVEKLSEKLKNIFVSNGKPNVEIILYDERLTTVASQKLMTLLGVKKENKKNIVDTIAAVYILQGYLDGLANKNI